MSHRRLSCPKAEDRVELHTYIISETCFKATLFRGVCDFFFLPPLLMSFLYAAESLFLALGNHSYSGELLMAMMIGRAASWDKPCKLTPSNFCMSCMNCVMQFTSLRDAARRTVL